MSTRNTERKLQGGGPWRFPVPTLSPGESYELPFRDLRGPDLQNGQKGYWKRWLPFDVLKVTNPASDPLGVEVNGIFDDRVQPNAEQVYAQQDVTGVVVTAPASNANDVTGASVVVKVDPYDSDDAARSDERKPWLRRAADDLIPGGVPGGF